MLQNRSKVKLFLVWGISDLGTDSHVEFREKYDGAIGFFWNQLQSLKTALKVIIISIQSILSTRRYPPYFFQFQEVDWRSLPLDTYRIFPIKT